MTWFSEAELRFLKELGLATLAAGLGGYVRARRNPQPLTRDRLVVVAAESVLCGFLCFGVSRVFSFEDVAVSYAIAGAFGLVGTAFISDIVVKIVERKADPPA